MKPIRCSFNSETDLDAVLALKQVCTTPQNIYDRPTVSDLRNLLTPIAESTALTSEQSSWQEALQGMSPESRHRAATQRLTALWEDVSSQLVAYALMIQPGCILTYQIHPEVKGQGLEAVILAWGLEQTQAIVQARGGTRELWCRCHESEYEYRSALEAAGFSPLQERDLCLVHALASPVRPSSLAEDFALKFGVTPSEHAAYQELHQAVFDGMSMGMEYHLSSAYQPELDLIAVEPTGRFGAFCKCELKRVADQQGEYLVGEVGVIGTRPELRYRGLGQALLLRGLRQMQVYGATSAFLETQESNVSAQRLFTSVGFTHLSTWQWYIKTVGPYSPPIS
jgi:mycothiol synthase